jgi:hypothetical protein
METLANTPKQEEHKLNLRLTGFEAKEGETEKELVQWFNTELLEGQMKLCTKLVIATWQETVITWTSTLAISVRPDAVLLKFTRSEYRQVAL